MQACEFRVVSIGQEELRGKSPFVTCQLDLSSDFDLEATVGSG